MTTPPAQPANLPSGALLLVQMAAPTLAVLIGWIAWQNAWAAIGLYHVQILCGSRGELPRVWRGWNRRMFLTFALPALATVGAVYILLPTATSTHLGTWFQNHGLEGWQLGVMIPYFGIVHPILEQAHWGRLRESRYGTFSHLAFAAYHGIVVVSLLTPAWLVASLLILVSASWIWTYMARQARGGLLVPTLSHIFADLGMIAAAALLVFGPSPARAESEFPLEMLREAVVADDPVVRGQALQMLGRVEADSAEVLYLFREALQDTSLKQLQSALWGLQTRGETYEDVLPLLRQTLERDNIELVRRTLNVLSAIGRYWPVCADLEQARLDPRPKVRAAAVNVMGPKICDPDFVLPLLAQSLLDEEVAVRKIAASAIAAYRAEAIIIVDELVAAVDDPDFNVQITIVRSLGTIGPAAAAALPTIRAIPAYGFAKDIVDTAIERISGEKPEPEEPEEP